MSTSIRQFNVGLYREHLEEASFLYEQRLTHLHDPEVDWPDLRGIEDRFEAHLDALVVGGDLALEICRLPAEDAGAVHAALCVFCRQDLKADAVAILTALDPTDEPALDAAARALRSEAPAGWRDDLLRLLQRDQSTLTGVLARVAGFRRYPCEELLGAKLSAKPQFGGAELAWALGRVGSPGSLPLLRSLLGSDDDRLREAASIALLRLGDDWPLQHARRAASTHAWARRVLSIGGDARSVRVLLDALDAGDPDVDTVLGLGLLGDLAAVAPLLKLLGHDQLGDAAAEALNTITGARLYAKVFVPDQVDPDELFDDEREAYDKDGTLPARDGPPLGNWEHRPLRDLAEWQAWLGENKHRFRRDYRWRMGVPYSPAALLDCLRCHTSPHAIRSATCEELVVRYSLEVPFEVDLRVHQQLRFLPRIEDWTSAASGRFEDGRWYFAGQLQG